MRITITEQVRTLPDLYDLLEHIVDQLSEGMTSGYHPNWSLQDVGTFDCEDCGAAFRADIEPMEGHDVCSKCANRYDPYDNDGTPRRRVGR